MNRPRRIVVGVSGGIGAYKIPALIRLLRKEDAEVKTVLTRAAGGFLGMETLRTVSGNPVFTDAGPSEYEMSHIRLSQWADVLCVCPATANTIAKIAHGIADNLLTTLALSFGKSVILAPAMNCSMWRNPATRDNVAVCKQRGIRILPVAEGELACGEEGPGRMLEPETIAAYILNADLPLSFEGKHIVIASGPTLEPIDAVRHISNASSGRMGAALARTALAMGAEVTVVSGPAPLSPPQGVSLIRVTTAEEMRSALHSVFESADVCIMAAAVGDFRPKRRVEGKIDRHKEESRTVRLVPNPDIAAELGAGKGKRFLVGFALETEEDEERARTKMADKLCDMMILNTVGASLGGEQAAVIILTADGATEKIAACAKQDVARRILIRIAQRMGLDDGA